MPQAVRHIGKRTRPARSIHLIRTPEEPLGEEPRFDLRRPNQPWTQRRKDGKALRERFQRESHSDWKPAKNRPDPLGLIEASNTGRQKELIPIRMGRMAESPLAFLRGAAVVMAWDLGQVPVSGVKVIIDGDAHLHNFGLFGTPQRDVIFDLNDFDDATLGPWEWDLRCFSVTAMTIRSFCKSKRRSSPRTLLICLGVKGI